MAQFIGARLGPTDAVPDARAPGEPFASSIEANLG
jgi:hypothetical protein